MQIVPETTMWEFEDEVVQLLTPPTSGASYPSVQLRQGHVAVKLQDGILIGLLGADLPKIGQRVKVTVEVIG